MLLYVQGLPRWADLLGLGYLGVHLFLLLSGFCVSWAYLGPEKRRFTTLEFAGRRAERILPAYYVAFVFFLMISPAFSHHELVRQIATHLTMTHNLFADTVLRINGTFWSLALECQLYLLFPLLLLGFRRIGPVSTLMAVLAFQTVYRVYVAHKIGTSMDGPLPFVMSWSVLGRMSEFALGMWAAYLIARGSSIPAKSTSALPILMMALFVAGFVAKHRYGATSPVTDLLWSGGFFALLLAGSIVASPIHRALTWRPLANLGVISYSVYLVHELPLTLLCRHIHLPGGSLHMPAFLLLLACVLGATIAASFVYYRIVEKPALDYFARRRKAARRLQHATVTETEPAVEAK